MLEARRQEEAEAHLFDPKNLDAAEKAKLLIKTNLGSRQVGEWDSGPGASAIGRNRVVAGYL